jgi:hypothetical protein
MTTALSHYSGSRDDLAPRPLKNELYRNLADESA